jgi:predicted RNase H-like HicB family nuclease
LAIGIGFLLRCWAAVYTGGVRLVSTARGACGTVSCLSNWQRLPSSKRPEGAAVMRYAIVIEKADGNYSAYVPDLPGCVAAGPTVEAVEQEIRDAIRFHIDGLKADGLQVPAPTSIADYVDA